MAISMAKAKSICSAGELALVAASSKQEIGRHTAARLRQKESRARKLRDKWRDLSNDQQRSSQAKGVAEGVNQRTAEKAALFDEVLGRYTAELAKRDAAGETPGPMGRRRSTRSTRSQTHRADRAIVRDALVDMKRDLKAQAKAEAESKSEAKPKPKAKAKAKSSTKAPGSTQVKTKAKGAGKGKAKAPSAPRTATSVRGTSLSQQVGLASSKGRGSSPVAGSKGLQVSAAKLRGAQAAAKQSRLRAGGLVNIQKHRSAANKRSQGRRDAR
ncbi:MAG: hypothetical protein U0795_06590 [Pirellulales bacterium]